MWKRSLCLYLLLGSLPVPAAALNSLYFGLDNMRKFAEVYWWFLGDGRVLYGLPKSGLAPEDFEKACQANPAYCGNYTLSGDKLAIKYRDGKSEERPFKTINGGIQIGYIVFTAVQKFPAGTHLNGAWSRPFSSTFRAGSGSATVTSPTFLTFKPDGTFAETKTTGIETVSAVKGASVNSSGTSQAGGTYTIKDYVLVLVRNGQSEKHMIFPVAGDNLNIDGQVYTKQK